MFNSGKISSIDLPLIVHSPEKMVSKSNRFTMRNKIFFLSGDKYRKDGWNILNKIKGGNLGGTIVKWTKDKCLEVGLKCITRKEFIVNFPGVYISSIKNGWLDEIYSKFENIVKSKNYWTKERCQEESLKYKSKTEFRKLSISSI